MLVETPVITDNPELDVVKLFEEKRWGHTPQCPYCGSERLSKRRKDLRFKCLKCKRSGSVTVNSALHDTRLPLSLWLKAFTLTSDDGKIPVSQKLQKELNISYKSAVRMHNKIESFLLNHDEILNGNTLDTLISNSMKEPQPEVLMLESHL